MQRPRACLIVAAAILVATAASTVVIGTGADDAAVLLEHVVRIDAIVSDSRGRRIDTLAASYFELKEDGAPRVVDNVTFVRSSAAPGRRFGIFLDEYYVDAGPASARVREAMTRFVDRELTPEDQLVVMKP